MDSDTCDVHTIVTKIHWRVLQKLARHAGRIAGPLSLTNLHIAVQNSADICFTYYDWCWKNLNGLASLTLWHGNLLIVATLCSSDKVRGFTSPFSLDMFMKLNFCIIKYNFQIMILDLTYCQNCHVNWRPSLVSWVI